MPDFDEAAREARVAALQNDWRNAGLEPADERLCQVAEKLTASPSSMDKGDIAELRLAGFDDVAIHSAAQVIAYFNYINRVADALDVELEPEMVP